MPEARNGRAQAQAEVLATLAYAVHAGKSCTLVLGDSGSGKTLLGRLVAQRCADRIATVWVCGIGQPSHGVEATLFPPGALQSAHAVPERELQDISLSRWVRAGLPSGQPVLVVVDDADALRPRSWEDLLALVTREVRAIRPVSLVLLGLPELADTLAQRALVRLQRRVFRACRLAPLARRELGAYVQHRLVVAGGDGSEIFTSAALDLIQQLSGGNPALINQLCDNALVEAFGAERRTVDATDVRAMVRTITAGVCRRRLLKQGAPAAGSAALPAPARVARNPQDLRTLLQAVGQELEHAMLLREVCDAADLVDGHDTVPRPASAAPPQVEPVRPVSVLPQPDSAVEERLASVQARLQQVLACVRGTRNPVRVVEHVDVEQPGPSEVASPAATAAHSSLA
ncbi:MAG: AAA family ATPase [Planctomycetota bacterium]